MMARLGLCRMVRMPGGHQVHLTNPNFLVNRIIDAGRD
jgi:hypothetical protein